jgi:hypothetical protein
MKFCSNCGFAMSEKMNNRKKHATVKNYCGIPLCLACKNTAKAKAHNG